MSVTQTQSAIDNQVAKIACCSANLSFSLVDNEERGVENCECSWSDLSYLVWSKKTLQNFIPVGAVAFPATSARAIFTVTPSYTLITSTSLHINGALVYNHAGSFATVDAMLTDLCSTSILPAYVNRLNPKSIKVLSDPNGFWNGLDVVFSFIPHNFVDPVVMTAKFVQGQYIQTGAMNCLSDDQVQNIIETTTSICGCSDCLQNTDTTPQPGAIIIYQPTPVLTIVITSADFVSNTYTPTGLYSLIGKIAGTAHPQFNVFSDPGGTLLNYPADYTFNISTGTLIMPPGGYLILIYS